MYIYIYIYNIHIYHIFTQTCLYWIFKTVCPWWTKRFGSFFSSPTLPAPHDFWSSKSRCWSIPALLLEFPHRKMLMLTIGQYHQYQQYLSSWFCFSIIMLPGLSLVFFEKWSNHEPNHCSPILKQGNGKSTVVFLVAPLDSGISQRPGPRHFAHGQHLFELEGDRGVLGNRMRQRIQYASDFWSSCWNTIYHYHWQMVMIGIIWHHEGCGCVFHTKIDKRKQPRRQGE